MEAASCALWVGFGENSYARASALIGGSPPLGFGWEYSGEASRRPSPNVNTSHRIILRCSVLKHGVKAVGLTHTHTHVNNDVISLRKSML